MSLGALNTDSKQLQAELNRLKSILEGKVPGVQSSIINGDDLSNLPPLTSFVIKGDPQQQDISSFSEVTKTRSTSRDIPYALAGRRFLFTNGLNRKILSVKHRMQG